MPTATLPAALCREPTRPGQSASNALSPAIPAKDHRARLKGMARVLDEQYLPTRWGMPQ